MNRKILAIDIGGSKLITGLVDDAGKVLASTKRQLPPKYNIQLIIDSICRMSEEYLKEQPEAVGVTIPGLADAEKGIWKYAPFSSISDIPIAAILSEKLRLPVYIDNDVNACALAEKKFGACTNTDNFLWITVSNGIGGALCLNGEIFCGEHNSAGEIGHFIVEEHTDRICGCGKKGCLEAMASGRGIARTYFEWTGKEMSAQEIAALAAEGDENARKAFELAGFCIGKALSYSINLLNISHVVIGGGVSQSFELLYPSMMQALERYMFAQANPDIKIEKTQLGYYAALVGCAAVALQ